MAAPEIFDTATMRTISPEGVVFASPPTGFRGNAAALVIAAIVGLIFFGLFSTAGISGLAKRPDLAGYLFVGAFLSLAVLLPGALICVAIQLARRRITFTIGDEQVTLRYDGPIRRSSHSFARCEVSGFTASQVLSKTNGKPINVLNLHAEKEDLTLLHGLPKPFLDSLAAAMNEALAQGRDESSVSPLLAEFPRPPTAHVAMQDDGTTLTLLFPAKGWRRAGWAPIVTFLLSLFFGGVLVVALLDHQPNGREIVRLLKIGLSVVVTGYAFFVSLQWAFRRSALVVAPGLLAFSSTSPLRNRDCYWTAQDIREIQVVEKRVDKAFHYHLEIISTDRKPEVLLPNRDRLELEWIAHLIRARVGLPAHNSGAVDED